MIASLLLLGLSANAQLDTVVGLNFTTGQLRFAKLAIAAAADTPVVNPGVLSADQFQVGVSDYDPIQKRYFYVRGIGGGSQLITVDARTGNRIGAPRAIPNPNQAVQPFTCIAYNWLNDTLYGLNFVDEAGFGRLRLATFDPNTGQLNITPGVPAISGSFLSGNTDIDPIHRQFICVTLDRIYVIDLDNGRARYKSLTFPIGNGQERIMNIAYNWLDGKLYGMYWSPDPSGGLYPNQLKLATIDRVTGVVTVISPQKISNDGLSVGDCDIDPSGNRFLYVRQNGLYQVDLTTGNLIAAQPIRNPNGAISPITSIAYDDFAQPPLAAARMDMGGDTLRIAPGDSVMLDAFVSTQAQYTWEDSSQSAWRWVDTTGHYVIDINQNGFQIHGEITVVLDSALLPPPPPTSTFAPTLDLDWQIFPNPATASTRLQLTPYEAPLQCTVFNAVGQPVFQTLLQPGQQSLDLDVSLWPAGGYSIQLNDGQRASTQQFIKLE